MPPFEGVLTEEQITEVAVYVSAVAGNLEPVAAATDMAGAAHCGSRRTPIARKSKDFRARKGGEGGIRTLDAPFGHARDFQSRSFGQLGHLSACAQSTAGRGEGGGPWGNHGFPHLKEEAPPTMSTGPPETGLWGERNPAP